MCPTNALASFEAMPAPRPRRRTVPQPAWQPQQITEFLIQNYGGVSKIAALLGVSRNQPTRWRNSEELPGPEATAKLVSLEAVVRRALILWEPAAVSNWMGSPNAFLEGAHPVDVTVTRGPSEVLMALEAEAEGAFA